MEFLGELVVVGGFRGTLVDILEEMELGGDFQDTPLVEQVEMDVAGVE